MSPREIKALLALRSKTPTTIARAIGEDRNAVNQTINYLRSNQRIRTKIADHLGMPVSELFDDLHVYAKTRDALSV